VLAPVFCGHSILPQGRRLGLSSFRRCGRPPRHPAFFSTHPTRGECPSKLLPFSAAVALAHSLTAHQPIPFSYGCHLPCTTSD
jgi:hypothetical protein